MVSLSDRHIEHIKNKIKTYEILSFLYTILVLVLMIKFVTSPANTEKDFAKTAVTISLLAVVVSWILFTLQRGMDFKTYLKDNEIKQKEDEIKHIENSISLFYVPLQNLLTVYDKSGPDEFKLKMINEINGYKHLAEPRVRFLFEIYIQGNEESTKVSRKLLSLVYRDIENLQKRLLNEQ